MSDGYSRRDFLKTAGVAAVSSVLPFSTGESDAQDNPLTEVPVRPFGKTGVQVSILGLGGMFDIPSNQLLLKQALNWGVTYWDTADCYEGGRSEKGFGMFFEKYPEDRKKIFLVTKSDDRDPEGMTQLLNQSLERLKTSYIDLYLVHGIRSIKELNNDTKVWAEKAKSQQKIRFFGFSTHKNMEECLHGAAKLGWIDGIMMTYNYRIMHEDEMKSAVDACVKAGIGLTAMKTQGGGSVSVESEAELEMGGKFLKLGFTDKQAKLKAVWTNPNIASICSQMPNMTILMANTAAAMNKTTLSSREMDLLKKYAKETCSQYCAGCSNICESITHVPVSDIMRFLMYSRYYGEKDRARKLFAELPISLRQEIEHTDYTNVEKICPQKIAISRLMKEAIHELA